MATSINYRALYDERFHSLTHEERLTLAQTEQGELLKTLCFDPSVVIIRTILRNPEATVEHARLIAAHHMTTTGLMALSQRPEFLRDRAVRESLLKNPLSSETTLRNFLMTLNLGQLSEVAHGHDSTAKGREVASQKIRQKTQHDAPSEVLHFIILSEGRSLVDLRGDPLPQEVINGLCMHKEYSDTLVNNLAGYQSLPPRLIEHLWRQPVVRYNQTLKRKLRAHRNCPRKIKMGEE